MCSTNVEENAAKEKDFFKLLLLLFFNTQISARKLFLFGGGDSDFIAELAIIYFTDRRPPLAMCKGTQTGKRKKKLSVNSMGLCSMRYHIFDLGENNQMHKSHVFIKKNKTNKQKNKQKNPNQPYKLLIFIFSGRLLFNI